MRCALELRQTLVDQVVADVPRTIAGPGAGIDRRCTEACQFDRLAGYLALGQVALLRYPLNCMAVSIAGGKIHPAIDAAWILPQRVLDDALRLHECAPVGCAENPETANTVADRDLVGGLLLVLGLHEVLDGQTRFRQAQLDPGQGQCQGGPASLQAPRELGDEAADHRRIRARHVGDHQDQALGIADCRLRHPLCPGSGQVSLAPTGCDAHADATKILDHCQPQHDRDRPQLAQLHRAKALVGRHEAAQTVNIHATIAMCNGLQRDVVHPRTPGRRPVRETREFTAVTFWQVPLGGPDLLFDEIEIVEQPFTGRHDPAALGGRRRQQLAHVNQGAFVVCQPSQEQVRCLAGNQLVRSREYLAVQRHLIGAVQLGAQRGFCVW